MSNEAIRKEWEEANKRVEQAMPQEQPEVPQEQPEVQEPVSEEVIEPAREAAPVQQPAQTYQEPDNFKYLRDSKRELERKYEELARRVADLSNPKPQQAQQPQPHYDLGDEDYAMGSHVKSVKAELEEVRKELAAEKQAREKVLAETRLRAKFPDVYDVVNEDNFKILMEREPEEAQTILSDPNPYTQHVSAYKAIKRYGIGMTDQMLQDRARAQANLAKPRSAATVAPKKNESPLAMVENYYGPMSSEEKARLRKETEDAINGRF